MQHYEHLITVQPADIDVMNHVNNVVYVQWVQDAASAHWRAYAPQEMLGKYNWVVRVTIARCVLVMTSERCLRLHPKMRQTFLDHSH
jgi:acyl-CoA thioesterase FadM